MVYILYILLAILLFGLLVAVHEFGHFITAKLSGVRVNEFAIGMGPAIFKKKLGETVYALRILPFGGFCAMEGEDSESEDPRAFGSRPLIFRILIVVAGSVMNLLMGVIVIAIIMAPVREWYTPTVENIAATEAQLTEENLHAGDTILRIDGYRVHLYSDLFVGLQRGGKDGAYELEVLRDGTKMTLSDVKFQQSQETGKDGQISFVVQKSTFAAKTKYIFANAYNLVRMVKVGLVDLFSGAVSKDDISGPIGIGKIMVDTAKTSMPSLWYLFAFISINLGIMNLLPFPALDGGRLIFLLIELVRGKPIAPKYESYVHAAGLILLLLVMLFVTFNDVTKLFIK